MFSIKYLHCWMKLCLPTIIKIRAHTGIVSPSVRYTRNSHRSKRGQYIWPCAANNMSMALPGFIRSAFCILNDARWSIVVERLTYACRVVLEVITWLKYKILDTVSHYIYMSKIDLKLNSVCDEDAIERSGQTRASDLRGCQAAANYAAYPHPVTSFARYYAIVLQKTVFSHCSSYCHIKLCLFDLRVSVVWFITDCSLVLEHEEL